MADILDNDKKFKEAVGAFIIAFSEFEHGLAELCAFTHDFELSDVKRKWKEYLPLSFERKSEQLTSNLKRNYPGLLPLWGSIKEEVGQLNRHRRFLAHGFVLYTIPNDQISTFINHKGFVKKEDYSAPKINELTQKLYHLNTGKNGVWGRFRDLIWSERQKQISE